MIIHDSRDTFFRMPSGAVSNGTTVILRLAFDNEEIPKKCRCNVWNENLEKQLDMVFHESGQYFECFFDAVSEGPVLRYYFVFIYNDSRMLFYGNNDSLTGGIGRTYANKPSSYQITVYDSSFSTPSWWKEGPVYHIFIDRFYKSDSYENPEQEESYYYHDTWENDPLYLPHGENSEYFPDDFFGGNLKGIIEKLDYIRSLGTKTIYLSPVFEAHSNHKYDTADYSRIAPDFGNDLIFKELCDKALALDMKVILDGVFSHTGDDSIYFNKYDRYESVGAYQSKESPYYEWFTFTEFPDVYKCWWDFVSMPTVNKLDPGFMDFINGPSGIIRKWIREGSWGWRLDVADELPMEFLRALRKAARDEKPDALIIGEVWEDASNKVAHGEMRNYCYGDTLDSVMNYPLRTAILSFMTGEITSQQASDALNSLMENYPPQFLGAAMNLIGSHDRARVRTVLAGAPDQDTMTREQQAEFTPDPVEYALSADKVMCTAALLFTLPGVPHIYYGDEAGMAGMSDPFCRKTYPWGRENKRLLEFYKYIGSYRRNNEILMNGTTRILTFGEDILGCQRVNESGGILTLINRNPSKKITISDSILADFTDGKTELEIPSLSYLILENI